MRKRKISHLRRDRSAVSPGGSVADIDLLMADLEAQLSCPHANPKLFQKHKCPGCKSAQWLLERPIAIAHSLIAAPDCIHFLYFSCANCTN